MLFGDAKKNVDAILGYLREEDSGAAGASGKQLVTAA
jgi:hypothetical protein